MPTFDLAEAVVEFAVGSKANWDNFNLPIPANVVILTTDSKLFKRGDGVHKYKDLPDGPSITGIAAGEESLVNVLAQLIPADEDCFIIVDDEIYKPSSTKITDVIARLQAIINKDTIQDANMDAISAQFSMVQTGLTLADNGKLAVINNHKLSPGITPDSILILDPLNPVHIVSFDVFSDVACKIPCSSFKYDSIYYAKIDGCHDTVDTDSLSYELTETNNYVNVTNLGRGKFKITVGKPNVASSVEFTAKVTFSEFSSDVTKTVVIDRYVPIMVALYGGTGADAFREAVIDSSGNIYCVGQTASEGLGGTDALIVKFDSNLNILAKKRYGGAGDDAFIAVAIDPLGSIYAVGFASSDGLIWDALIIKFDSSLNILAKKYFYGSMGESFYGIVITSVDAIYVTGYTESESAGNYDGIIVKFNSSLTILAKKRYGGISTDEFNTIKADSSGNIYVSGQVASESAGNHDCIVIKFDSNLSILARKRIVGVSTNTHDIIMKMFIDTTNNIYIVGHSDSEAIGVYDSIIVKLDTNLNILAKKRFGGIGDERSTNITVDSSGNIYFTGFTKSDNNIFEGVIVKFDSSFNIISKKKVVGNVGNTIFQGVVIDTDNIYVFGYTAAEGAGFNDCLIMKLPKNIPAGIITGTAFPNIILTDISATTVGEFNCSLAESTLTFADITTITLADSNLTAADSNLTYRYGEI